MSLSNRIFLPPTRQWRKDCCKKLNLTFIDSMELDHSSLSEFLGTPLRVHHIKGDGNCLFRVLSFLICGDESQHTAMRKIITNFMATDDEIEKSGLLDPEPSQYLLRTKMTEDGTWGTDIELTVASNLFGIPIYTYSLYGDHYAWLEFLPREINRNTVSHALYIQHTSLCHYDAVIAVNDRTEENTLRYDLNADPLTTNSIDSEDELGKSIEMLDIMNLSGQTPEVSFDDLGMSIDCLSESLGQLDFSLETELSDKKGSSETVHGKEEIEDPYDIITEYEDSTGAGTCKKLLTSTPRKKQRKTQMEDYGLHKYQQSLNGSDLDVSEINNDSFQESVGKIKKSPRSITLSKSKLLQKALDSSHMCSRTLNTCSLNCFPNAPLSAIRNCRYRFWAKSIEQRIEWFLDKVCEGKMKEGKYFFILKRVNLFVDFVSETYTKSTKISITDT